MEKDGVMGGWEKKQQAGEWVSEWATSASTATRQSPK